jgi:hypothetical protein
MNSGVMHGYFNLYWILCALEKLRNPILDSYCLFIRRFVQLIFQWPDILKNKIWKFFKNMPRKLHFNKNLSRVTGALHEDNFFLIMSRWIFLTINVSDKVCSENQKTHFIFSIFLNSYLYEKIYEKMALPYKPQRQCYLWPGSKT